jgi:serine/threonine protein kinase
MNIRTKILRTLGDKTRGKYKRAIYETWQNFLKILPEPISIRPQEPEVLNPNPRVLVWPPQLSDLDIDEQIKGQVEGVFDGFLQSLNVGQASGSFLICERDVCQGLTLRFFYSEYRELRDVMLMTERVFGKLGGLLCYSLTHGKYFFRRKAPTEEGRAFLRTVVEGTRGLRPPLAINRTSEDGESPEQWEVITRCPEGALPDLFRTKPLMEPKQIRSLVGDLLSALAHIHRQPKEVKYQKSTKGSSQSRFSIFSWRYFL